mmetsp:Transcript_14434/g.27401  ORF Transcript_14434/g.27401 Transcript_14434/m.27401 type:complete len:351 (-) Transcript_14434:216-1268(-)
MWKRADRWWRSAIVGRSVILMLSLVTLVLGALVMVGAIDWKAMPRMDEVNTHLVRHTNAQLLKDLETCRADLNSCVADSADPTNANSDPSSHVELAMCREELDDFKSRLQSQSSIHEASVKELRELTRAVGDAKGDCDRRVKEAESKSKANSPPQTKKEYKELKEKWDKVTSELQIQSRNALRKQYGEGKKIIVKMQTSAGPLAIEMAPDTVMPYVTKWFVDLVESGYWDGCGFVRAAGHVLQANCNPKKGPHTYPSIAFQEYSEDYTHKLYTVGVAGFPGGPDWYINIVDNVRNHGPGGQGPPEANPCFGKVVDGFQTIEAIKKAPHEPSGFNGIFDPIIISKASITVS